MTEFEKKSLCYALTYVWICLLTLLPHCPEFLDDYHLLLLAGAFVVLLLLYYVFDVWKTAWTSGGYLREDNLTERELFLSYKATSKTLVFFTFLVFFAIISVLIYKIMYKYKPTYRFADISGYAVTIIFAFLSAKSFVLYTYLRKEPRELPEVH